MIVEVCGVGPAEALEIDALLALAVCGAKAKRVMRTAAAAAGGGRGDDDEDGRVTLDPVTGRQTTRIRSMDTLRRLLPRGSDG